MNIYHNIKTKLYHGTVSEIEKIDVSLGRNRKDFGKGFYMADKKNQAIGMMHKKYREAMRRQRGRNTDIQEILYEIELNEEVLRQIDIKIFTKADLEWLDFVLECREKGGMPHRYDLVIGPTADDDTAVCLKVYADGLYGKIGSIGAKQTLLNNLEPDNLGTQYFIGKQEVADKLILDIKKIDWR